MFFKTYLSREKAVDLKIGSHKSRKQKMRKNNLFQKICLKTHRKEDIASEKLYLESPAFLPLSWGLRPRFLKAPEAFLLKCSLSQTILLVQHPALSFLLPLEYLSQQLDLNCKWKLPSNILFQKEQTLIFWKQNHQQKHLKSPFLSAEINYSGFVKSWHN